MTGPQHWRLLTRSQYAFSAPNTALRLLIPYGARPQIPASLCPLRGSRCGANPGRGSGAVGDGGRGTSHGHPTPCGRRESQAGSGHEREARTDQPKRPHQQRGQGHSPRPPRTSELHWTGISPMYLGKKQSQGRKKIKEPTTSSLNPVSKPTL